MRHRTSPGDALDERGTPQVKTVTLSSTGGDVDLESEIAGLQATIDRLTVRIVALEALAKPDTVTPVPAPTCRAK